MIKLKFMIGLFIVSSFSFAGGFKISLQGVRQLGMAHTSAHTKDASVMFFNPAGMSFIPEKLSISAGGFAVITETEFQNSALNYKAKTDNPVGTPFYLASSYKVLDDLSVGLSVTTPYGNTVEWDENWMGNNLVQNISLKAVFVQPTISYKFNEWFSFGGGFIYSTGNIELGKAISGLQNQNGTNSSLNLSSNAKGYGYNLGMYFKPTQKLEIGVSYRSKVEMKAENGEAKFKTPASLANTFIENDRFNAKLPLASEFILGFSYKVTPKLLLAADINAAGWESYKSLNIDFEKSLAGNTEKDRTLSSTPKEFKNSMIYRIGSEYSFNDKLAARLGYYYDQSPVQDQYWSPETPSNNNHAVTAGLGYSLNKAFHLDFAGSYLVGKIRDISNDSAFFYGQARNTGLFFGLGITYNK